jgi:hypothetical protein
MTWLDWRPSGPARLLLHEKRERNFTFVLSFIVQTPNCNENQLCNSGGGGARLFARQLLVWRRLGLLELSLTEPNFHLPYKK